MESLRLKWVLMGIGGLLLLVGIFLPVAASSVVGSATLFVDDRAIGGLIICGVLLLALVSALRKWTMSAYLAGLTAGLAFYALARTHINLQGTSRAMSINAADGFSTLAEQMMASPVQLSWGAPVLVLGALLLLGSTFLRPERARGHRILQPAAAVGISLLLGGVGIVQGQAEARVTVAQAQADADSSAEEGR